MSLGIPNPVIRVIVWLATCASLSLAAFAAGPVGAFVLFLAYVSILTARVLS